MIGFGKRLKLLRKESRFTISKVATSLNISKSSYAGYESEFRKPPLDKLIQLAMLFNVSTDYLLGLEENEDSSNNITDIKNVMESNHLHWNGIKLTDNELNTFRDLLEIVAEKKNKKVN